ncbi:hypothetical protein [Paenibacillus antarcticus]|uniref:Uncharacterized protein n=1 Tax=Paenibacillus antarcticus TaxID=253703 RepID=A0A168NFD2_9BACL|nr:hypothetical protein [Paenibacillus antarcticus]OAB45739.1 hypothetical protein PBAT_12585 [Paenibacillus antarcticus]
MKLYVTVKNLGKRKNVLTKIEIELPIVPMTLRELITEVVKVNVQDLKDKQQGTQLMPFLTGAEIEARGENGKVGFSSVYNEQSPDVAKAVENALLAFDDGLYKVFIREEENSLLETPLKLMEEDEIVFIKFTMLAGSLW